MTRDEIISMTREASGGDELIGDAIERFAALVAARDEWRPASEPPEDGRDVVVWMNDGGHGCFAIGHCLRGEWSPNYLGSPVTHWRDVSPPAENQR